MNQTQSKTVVIVWWSLPLLLMAAVVAANAGLAGVYARLLGLAGLAPAAGLPGAGYWALLFGALGLTHLPALAAFGHWTAAAQRERTARAEILAALRWPTHLDRWQPQLWPELAAPAVPHRPRRPTVARLRWHLPYATLFGLSLAGPLALAGLLAAG
ncbi:MAG TPA: hypothetical protein VKY74_13935 [Chloroflexia bacterium]|nr:hypothetical protein [Chloroflexia bacterium]